MIARYRVERADGESLGRPVDLARAIEISRDRLRALDDGDTLRIRKILYELPPERPPGTAAFTPAILKVYRQTVAREPRVGWAGGFVCKWAAPGVVSQHATRTPNHPNVCNAIDWTAPEDVEDDGADAIVDWLWKLSHWHVRRATATDRLPISEVIFRDKKWEADDGRWDPFGGTFHASHEHTSGRPYLTAPAACL